MGFLVIVKKKKCPNIIERKNSSQQILKVVTIKSSSQRLKKTHLALNFSALKIGGTVAFCLIIIGSLVANSLIVIIVYKTPNLKKPINYFIASDLLYPVFTIPWTLFHLHAIRFLSVESLARPCVSLSLSLVTFPLPFRFRI